MSDFYGVRYRGGGGSGFRDTTGEYTGGGGGRSRPGNVGAPAAGRPRRNMYDGLSPELKRRLARSGQEAAKAARQALKYRRLLKLFDPSRKAKLAVKMIEWTSGMDIPDPWDWIVGGQPAVPGSPEGLTFDYPSACTYVCPDPPIGGPLATAVTTSSVCPTPAYLKCLPGQVPSAYAPDMTPFTIPGNVFGNGRSVLMGGSNGLAPPLWRFKVERVYTIKTPPNKTVKVSPQYQPAVEPQPARAPQFYPHVEPWPYWIPDGLPITQPAPQPVRRPYKLLPYVPRVSPWPQGRYNDEPSTDGWIDPTTPGSVDPGAGPSVETDGGPLKPSTPHANVPPAPNEREKKRGYTPPQRVLKQIADGLGGTVGEAADAIDAVYDALEKKCRGANTPQAKLRCIWSNFDSLDMAGAVKNLIENEIEDRFFGELGKLNRKASKNVFPNQRGRGIMTGGAGQRYHGPYLKL